VTIKGLNYPIQLNQNFSIDAKWLLLSTSEWAALHHWSDSPSSIGTTWDARHQGHYWPWKGMGKYT